MLIIMFLLTMSMNLFLLHQNLTELETVPCFLITTLLLKLPINIEKQNPLQRRKYPLALKREKFNRIENTSS